MSYWRTCLICRYVILEGMYYRIIFPTMSNNMMYLQKMIYKIACPTGLCVLQEDILGYFLLQDMSHRRTCLTGGYVL